MNHKHIQLMPYTTLDGKGLIPLEQAAIVYMKMSGRELKEFQLPQFNKFKHIFLTLDRDFYGFNTDEELQLRAEKLHKLYRYCLTKLGHKFTGKTDQQSYNIVLCRNFLFIVLRSTDSFVHGDQHIAMGGKAFVGIPYANDEAQRKVMKEVGLLKILESVSEKADKKK